MFGYPAIGSARDANGSIVASIRHDCIDNYRVDSRFASEQENDMVISIRKDRVLKVLMAGIVLLFVAHTGAYVVEATLGFDYIFGLVPFVDFYEETNLPTWYSTMLLTTSALLLFVVYRTLQDSAQRLYWLALAGIFLFLALDEFAQLHELIGSYISQTEAQDLLPDERSSAWIFWGAGLVSVVGIVYLRFWWRLTHKVRLLFFWAGVVYVGGALGFEVAEIFYIPSGGGEFGFFILVTLEEMMEMIGIWIFIWGILEQLLLEDGRFELRLLQNRDA